MMGIFSVLSFLAGSFMVLVFPSVGAICFIFSILCALGAIENKIGKATEQLKSINETLNRTSPKVAPPVVAPEKKPLIEIIPRKY